MRFAKWICLAVGVGTVAACGATPAERGATGALGGAAIAQATGGSALEGALYGGAIGAFRCEVAPNQQRGC